jgi:hypothetical protein
LIGAAVCPKAGAPVLVEREGLDIALTLGAKRAGIRKLWNNV